MDSSGAAAGIFSILLLLVVGVVALVGLAFWIWMLVDCATKESGQGNDKIIWILVIVLTGWLGALIYFFVRRPQRRRELGA